MVNNPDIPAGWSMPDDMAKRINEVINKKPISPEDELADTFKDMERDIALIESNPVHWGLWLMYLLEEIDN